MPDSLTVKHIKTGEDITLSKRQLGQILVMTIADFADQLFSWQDKLFEHNDGKVSALFYLLSPSFSLLSHSPFRLPKRSNSSTLYPPLLYYPLSSFPSVLSNFVN
jgi:hypothetical protein